MAEFAARIRRVRMKNGGADVRVLPQPNRPYVDEEDYRSAIVKSAEGVVEYATDECPLQGYVVIGIFDDGSTSVGFRHNGDATKSIPRTLLPAWLAEIMRRELLVSVEAEDTFNRMFQWQEG